MLRKDRNTKSSSEKISALNWVSKKKKPLSVQSELCETFSSLTRV